MSHTSKFKRNYTKDRETFYRIKLTKNWINIKGKNAKMKIMKTGIVF